MPNPTISIVTTVYDAKDYIPRTVRSILAQSFTDFELLLVEDGSPNGCGELCDELAKTDPRIRVFHKENGGPASALNVGLDNARGDYIGFVDSDDLVDPDLYETLLNAIRENDVRIASCNADAVDEQEKPVPGAGVNINIAGRHMAMELLLDTFKTGGFYGLLCWNKLFDIRLFRDKGVHFDETMFFGDDASELYRQGSRARTPHLNAIRVCLFSGRTRFTTCATCGWRFNVRSPPWLLPTSSRPCRACRISRR